MPFRINPFVVFNPADSATGVSVNLSELQFTFGLQEWVGDPVNDWGVYGGITSINTVSATLESFSNIEYSSVTWNHPVGLHTATITIPITNSLLPGRTYIWRVHVSISYSGYTGSGYISFSSDAVSFTTTGTPPTENLPPTAINPTPADTAANIAMAPLLQWELDGPLGDDDYFFIYLSTDIDEMGTAAGFQQGWIVTPRLQVLSGLVANTTYYWQVHVANAQGWTESAIWSFTTRNFAPPAPSLDGDTGLPTGENAMTTVRRLIAAARNRIYYEDI